GLAEKHHVSVTTLVLSWALQRDVVVLPRSRQPDHIKENACLLESRGDGYAIMSEEELAMVDALDGTI
ncbi:unnamed protein product, partial [Chrysoparadoxa australica]